METRRRRRQPSARRWGIATALLLGAAGGAPGVAQAQLTPPAERAGQQAADYVLAQEPGKLTPPVAAVDADGRPLANSAQIVRALRAADGVTITLPQDTVLDFGRYVTGRYERAGATADPVSAFADFVGKEKRLRDGEWYPARFVRVPGGEAIDAVGFRFNADLSQQPATLPVSTDRLPGEFMASDELLTRIWYSSASTMQLSMMAAKRERDYALYDGPERDRGIWTWYDSTANKTAFYGFGNLARGPTETTYDAMACPDGKLGVSNFLDPYTCYVVWDELGFTEAELWEAFNFYGNRAYVEQKFPTLIAHLDRELDAKLAPTGLYRTNMLPVPPNPADPAKGNDHSMLIEMWVYRALVDTAKLARELGEEATAQRLSTRAADLRAAVNRYLWDESKGAFRYFVGSDHVDQAGNSLAITTGLATAEQAARILTYLREHNNRVYDWSSGSKSWGAINPAGSTTFDKPFLPGDTGFDQADWRIGGWGWDWGMGQDPNDFSKDYNYNYSLLPWGQSFEVEANFTGGRDDAALDLVRRAWGTMLRWGPSTFYESSRWDGVPAYRLGTLHNSVDHRWGSGPGYLLQEYVLGVRAATPGFKRWTVSPHGGDLSWAQGRVPTPAGDLSTWWEKGDGRYTLQLSAPRGTSGDVALPVAASGTITLDGTVVWQDGKAVGDAAVAHDAAGGRVVVSNVGAGTHLLRWTSEGAAPQSPRVSEPEIAGGVVRVTLKRTVAVQIRCGTSVADHCNAELSLRAGESITTKAVDVVADRPTAVELTVPKATYSALVKASRLDVTVGLLTTGSDGRTRRASTKLTLLAPRIAKPALPAAKAPVDATRRAAVKVRCAATAAGRCRGSVTLRRNGSLVGRIAFSIPAGRTTTVKVPVSKVAFATLRRTRTLATNATLAARGADGEPRTIVKRLTLTAPRRG